MHRVLAFGLLSLLGACSDRLTAPEAKAVLEAVEQPLDHSNPRDRLWIRMGWADGLKRMRTPSRVRVRRDGREHTYAAIVFERIMVPANGSGRSPCLGPRWSLFLWRENKQPEGFLLTGGQFDKPLSSSGQCTDIAFSDPAPVAIWYPPDVSGERNAWISESGRGEITSGQDAGPCDFLAEMDADLLHRRLGVTCRVTRHQVYLQSTLHPAVADRSSGAGSGTMQVEMRPVEVLGVRYTIDCSLPQASEMCRQASP